MALRISGAELEYALGARRDLAIGSLPLRELGQPNYDYVCFGYYDDRLISAVYKIGGEDGPIVASVRIEYDAAGFVLALHRLDLPQQ